MNCLIMDNDDRQKGYVTDSGIIYRYSFDDDPYLGYVDASGYVYETSSPGQRGGSHACVGQIASDGTIFQHMSAGPGADRFQVGRVQWGGAVYRTPNSSRMSRAPDDGREVGHGPEGSRRTVHIGAGALLLLPLTDYARPRRSSYD